MLVPPHITAQVEGNLLFIRKWSNVMKLQSMTWNFVWIFMKAWINQFIFFLLNQAEYHIFYLILPTKLSGIRYICLYVLVEY